MLPDCYDPIAQERARDMAHTARIMRRPCCECCGEHLETDEYLDLTPLGITGVLCEDCMNDNKHSTYDLDD